MADNTLNVEIKAEVDGLTKGLKKADKEVKGFGDTVNNTVDDINKTSKSVATAGKSFDKLGKSVKVNANPTVIEFSRVIQDAPFGIIGVANNIQQLTANFGDLSRQAGGSKNAFKAFLGAFTGTSGVLFVVSLVTTALITYGDEIKALTNKTEKLNQKQKKLVERLSAVSDSLGAQISALESTKNLYEAQGVPIDNLIKKELALLKVRKQNNLEQLKALQEQLKAEKKSSEGLSFTQQLGSFFGVSPFKDNSEKEVKKRFSNLKKIVSEEGGQIKEEFDKLKLGDIFNEKRSLKTRKAEDFIDDKEAKKIAEVETNIANIEKSLAQIDLDIFKIEEPDTFKANTKKKDKFVNTTNFDIFEKDLKAFELKSLALAKDLNTNLFEELSKPPKDVFSEASKSLTKDFATLDKTITDGVSNINIGGQISANLAESLGQTSQFFAQESNKIRESLGNVFPEPAVIDEKKQAYLETLKNLGSEVENLLEGSLGSALSNVGTSLGQALATGQNVLSSVGNTLLQSLAGFLSDLGGLLIKYGVAGLLYSKATKALLNPLTAGPAAGALIAAGIALKAIGGAISGALQGGASGGGAGGGQDFSSAGTNQSFSSTSNIANSGGAGGNFVFEIAGTKLIGVLKNTLDRNKAIGGQNNLLFS